MQTLSRLILAGLYLVGILHWLFFLNFGKVPFDLHDWRQAGAYYSFLQEAVQTGQFPLHMDSDLVTTERYLARPDTPLSPNIFLLKYLDPGVYTLVDTLFWYSIGFLGSILLKRRFRLSNLGFTVFFLLFNFKGYITAHLAVGHTMWIGYYLLPFFALQVFSMLDHSSADWTWVFKTALIFCGLFMLGAFHLALWCGMFIVVLVILYPRYLIYLGKLFPFLVGLSLWRVLPPAMEYRASSNVIFLTGFPSLTDLVTGLVKLVYPAKALQDDWMALGWWEFDYFIGLIGLFIIIIFGIYLPLRARSKENVLFAPIVGITMFSIGKIYLAIFSLPIPLLDSERSSVRFFIVPLVFLFILAVIHLQRFFEQKDRWGLRQTLFILGMIMVMGHDLFQHSRLWRVSNMYELFPRESSGIPAPVINHPDPAYTTAITVGAVISSIALILILVFVWRERKIYKQSEIHISTL